MVKDSADASKFNVTINNYFGYTMQLFLQFFDNPKTYGILYAQVSNAEFN